MEEGGTAYHLYVGIDVAAETFVAAWLAPGEQPGTPVIGEQTAAGFAALQRLYYAEKRSARAQEEVTTLPRDSTHG